MKAIVRTTDFVTVQANDAYYQQVEPALSNASHIYS